MKRSQSLGMIGSILLLAHCGGKVAGGAVRVGSTNTDENATIAEVYATALERQRISVERHLRLGEPADALAALRRGTIDLYPGLVESNGSIGFTETWNGITSLVPSPANDSPCLLTSQYAAEQFWLLRLSKCSAIASQLRLAATPDFLAPGGELEQLQRRYGGFRFRSIVKADPGTQYYILNRGDAEIANGNTTDANIAETQLIVLSDDKHLWPEQHPAPIVRVAALHAHPQIRPALNRISHSLTLYALQQLNTSRVVLNMDPYDAAEEFVSRQRK